MKIQDLLAQYNQDNGLNYTLVIVLIALTAIILIVSIVICADYLVWRRKQLQLERAQQAELSDQARRSLVAAVQNQVHPNGPDEEQKEPEVTDPTLLHRHSYVENSENINRQLQAFLGIVENTEAANDHQPQASVNQRLNNPQVN